MLQKEIETTLPTRPAEAEEALMSPRVENFVGNPFIHFRIPESQKDVSGVSGHLEDGSEEDKEPNTPGSNASDPRSPAQFGISPITRNIWGMI